ncbi:ABC transporter I family member 6 [Citrus sinensis]|uniref:ABC transporter I family member 6 n=2 Tax=Citrus sinensis TaxID=2711 RepID=A0ACB8L784_CITSI|nr:ABC transporter I family member 6 [Citrus sinensis]
MAAFLPSTSCCSFKFSNLPSKSHVFTLPALPLLCRRSNYHRHHLSLNRVTAALSAVDSPLKSSSEGQDEKSQPLLQVTGLTAVIAESKQEILKGVNLLVNEGEVHAIMGKNGSGKSTLSKVLVGHPDYEVTEGSVVFKGENLLEMEPEERSLAGLFMSFQSPVEIPGVNNIDFLHMAYNARRRKLGQPEIGPIEFYAYLYPKLERLSMKTDFLNRNVNEGFSGGERKRNEILQLAVLGADLAILDEIDSGLDVDALRDVAKAVNGLLTPKNSLLMITHYRRLLEFIKPTFIHIMEDGRIIKTGDASIATVLEEGGYKAISGSGSNFRESRGLGKILISICSWLVMIWEVVSAFDVVNDLVADSVPHADAVFQQLSSNVFRTWEYFMLEKHRLLQVKCPRLFVELQLQSRDLNNHAVLQAS